MHVVKTLAIGVSAAVLLAACSSTPTTSETKALPIKPKAIETAGTPDPRTVGTVTATSSDPLNDPKGALAKRSVYFDFDSYVLKQEFNPVVTAHAKYLSGNKSAKVLIQGNTDERGGSEYNLALGQKRAEAVRKAMELMGVPTSEMEAVSLGKEKPKALGSDDAAWAENRRSDIVYSK